MESRKEVNKQQIYYARTYRHLKGNLKQSLLYLFLFIIPILVLLLFLYGDVTIIMSKMAISFLKEIWPNKSFSIAQFELVRGLTDVSAVQTITVMPSLKEIYINIIVNIVLLLFLFSGKRKTKPISIYLVILVFFHLVSCIYFLFAAKYFPYSTSDFSELYMKQQVGIWIFFLVLTGIITAFMGSGYFITRMATVIGIMTYSLIFGVIRYIVSLYILLEFSILYMIIMFFFLGPFFDFLYLVAIYSFFMNRMINVYELKRGKERWIWS
ncbi:hypothetical protein SAMN00017405_0558 [Desulfonispora thiosulfatigenes DSM 11270]|uniref:Uncharacterized protein n=1 Tax=Desulfonispora thiosulfatigenes DSM 11270 TaxID=656914 RepID=A0A1W1V6C3_DESTI|nr:hypothetical protein [Desulfonispora thiosulfatigenes]SMB88979.1 hypothetical protein SAMN00017405_0558 [Desulfonispora thiosulfatigenes DSM 11270]